MTDEMTSDPTTAPPAEHPAGDPRADEPHRLRIIVFVVVSLAAVVLAIGTLFLARQEQERAVEDAEPVPVAATGAASTLSDDVADLVFASTALGDTYGFLATLPADGSSDERAVADLTCERVDFRSSLGVCLQADRGLLTTYTALIFDADLEVSHRVVLAGSPSRVRIAPGGSLAGATVFVSGHSYADAGFSTQTILLDLATGAIVADLETDFAVYRGSERWREVDFNFWGVTFVDDERFYATLGTGNEHFLVEGSVADRRLDIVTDDVECPSLSPDGTRVAYKVRRDGGPGLAQWQIMVLDLATMVRTTLAETRSVDDQVAWLDDETVMYGLPKDGSPAVTDTWVVSADGTGAAELFVEGAWSVVVSPA